MTPGFRRAKHYWWLLASIAAALLLLYLVLAPLQLPIVHAPSSALQAAGGTGAATLGVALLVGDVILPVPSSLVMIAHGALFGAFAGAVLSLAGRAGAFLCGYAIGAGLLPIAARTMPEHELCAANLFLQRRGAIAVLFTRPVPIVSEAVSVMAGLSSLPLGRCLAAAILGSLPESVILAALGSSGGTWLAG